MGKITEVLGFEARYVLYPLLALILAGLAKYVLQHFIREWAAKTENKADDQIVAVLDSAVLPLLLMAVLYSLTHWMPLSEGMVFWIQKAVLVAAVGLLSLFAAKAVSVTLSATAERRESLQRFVNPLKTFSRMFFGLVWVAVALKVLNINLSD